MGKKTRRTRKLSRHHLKNRVHGGGDHAWNILKLKEERHREWHVLFGNKDLPEIIKLLQRVHKMKEALKKGGF